MQLDAGEAVEALRIPMVGEAGKLSEYVNLRDRKQVIRDELWNLFVFRRHDNCPKHIPLFRNFRRFAPSATVPSIFGTGAKTFAIADHSDRAKSEVMVIGEPVEETNGREIDP